MSRPDYLHRHPESGTCLYAVPDDNPAKRPSVTRMLLIIAHGSRREVSSDEVRALAVRLRTEPGAGFDDVVAAVLEVATFDSGRARVLPAARCARGRGVSASPGGRRHVADDIPAAVAAFHHQYPGMAVTVTAHLGFSDLLPCAILRVASDAVPI